jgi:hypothetical protein
MIMGYVYLMLSISDDGVELYKVGVTKRDPKIRVKELTTFSRFHDIIL